MLKDEIKNEELDDLKEKDRQTILNEYEYTVKTDPFEINYINKNIHFGDIEDIITDQNCDLSFLDGAIIKKIGFHKKASEGGLTIWYEKNKQNKIVVLGFTELGMWIHANVEKK